jgi:hypothetical protein
VRTRLPRQAGRTGFSDVEPSARSRCNRAAEASLELLCLFMRLGLLIEVLFVDTICGNVQFSTVIMQQLALIHKPFCAYGSRSHCRSHLLATFVVYQEARSY